MRARGAPPAAPASHVSVRTRRGGLARCPALTGGRRGILQHLCSATVVARDFVCESGAGPHLGAAALPGGLGGAERPHTLFGIGAGVVVVPSVCGTTLKTKQTNKQLTNFLEFLQPLSTQHPVSQTSRAASRSRQRTEGTPLYPLPQRTESGGVLRAACVRGFKIFGREREGGGA